MEGRVPSEVYGGCERRWPCGCGGLRQRRCICLPLDRSWFRATSTVGRQFRLQRRRMEGRVPSEVYGGCERRWPCGCGGLRQRRCICLPLDRSCFLATSTMGR